MEDRDPVAEAGAEAADGLRRQPDLGDEHDRAQPPLERRVARLEVHLGLAAAGRAVQEEIRAEPLVHRADDPRRPQPPATRLSAAGLASPPERFPRGGLRPLGATGLRFSGAISSSARAGVEP